MLLPALSLRRIRCFPSRYNMSPSGGNSTAAANRLQALTRSLATSSPSGSSPTLSSSSSPALSKIAPQPLLGHLTLEGLRLPVHETDDKDRLPREDLLLDYSDPAVAAEILWLMKKWELRAWFVLSTSCSRGIDKCVYYTDQDVFLLASPGPFTRRLALTFLHLLNKPFEICVLHRDVGESELKQGREIRPGGVLEYTDSGAVRAAKEGKVLLLDGIERVERGVLPLLNNLLEYREMNLEDGTHIVSASRYDLMVKNGEDTTGFIPAHPDFRIVALGVPVREYSSSTGSVTPVD